MGTSHQLIMRRGPFQDNQYPLKNDHTIIGRATSCDIHIPDPEISRQHARMVAQGAGMYAIEDLGSTNGTFVNGRRASSLTPVNHNDIIDLGEALQFVFETVMDGVDTTPDFIIPGTGDYVIADEQAEAAAMSSSPMSSSPMPSSPTPQEPTPSEPTPSESDPMPPPPEQVIIHQIERSKSSKRNMLMGCGGVLLLTACCIGMLFVLDAYNGGELLYCGPLRPFWNVVLLPFGSPPCG